MSESHRSDESIYVRIGVTPIINCGGVRTFYGNSLVSDSVRDAMDDAGRRFVLIEELAEAIGQRLAALTGAEWGMVSAGSASGLALAAVACIAGNDPERMLMLPFVSEPSLALVPRHQRFSYDQALACAGCRVTEFASLEALETMLRDERVALICLLADRFEPAVPSFEQIVELARRFGVTVVVDAASEFLEAPVVWLQQGADLVVYSVGKFMRGPSATGVLLGRERLVRAAWVNASPHQGFGRTMKIGKEQMAGALVAVEEWLTRDAKSEQQRWRRRLDRIAESLADVGGLSLTVMQPRSPVPKLRVAWDRAVYPMDFTELREAMLASNPRILIDDIGSTESSMLIDPFNLADAEAPIVGRALQRFFTGPRRPHGDAGLRPLDIAGRWDVTIEFANGERSHGLSLSQDGTHLTGEHRLEFSTAQVEAQLGAIPPRIVSTHMLERKLVHYSFGIHSWEANTMSGMVTMGAASERTRGPVGFGQFGNAPWRAKRIG